MQETVTQNSYPIDHWQMINKTAFAEIAQEPSTLLKWRNCIASKVSKNGVFLVRIFPYLAWVGRFNS